MNEWIFSSWILKEIIYSQADRNSAKFEYNDFLQEFFYE